MRTPYVAITIYDATDKVLHRKDYEFSDLEEPEVFSLTVDQTHQNYFRRDPQMSEETQRIIESL